MPFRSPHANAVFHAAIRYRLTTSTNLPVTTEYDRRAGPRPHVRSTCVDLRRILALARRGVIHVRGKDCVHPDIGRIVRMISFPARESGQRARRAVP
jgi:hypothetical protein